MLPYLDDMPLQMAADPIFDREESLRKRLNAFLSSSFELPEHDYYARLNAEAFLGLNVQPRQPLLLIVDFQVGLNSPEYGRRNNASAASSRTFVA